MSKIKSIAIATAIALAAVPAKASDFGVWTSAGAEKKLGLFSLSVDGGLRTQDGFKNVDRWQVGFGVEFKPVKYFSVATSYDFLYSYKPGRRKDRYDSWVETDDEGRETTVSEYDGYNLKHAYWRCRNRWNFDLTGKLPVGRFTFSLRERFQLTRSISTTSREDKYRMESGSDEPQYRRSDVDLHPATNTVRLRSRLKVDYDIRHCPLTPYAYVEVHNNLRAHFHNVKTRLGIGTEVKISKRHRIDVGYVYQDSSDSDERGGKLHAIDVSYKYKF